MTGERAVNRFLGHRTNLLLGALVFLLSLLVFRRAPIQQAGDSRYSILLAENLLRHGDFILDRYHLPEPDYRIEHSGGHDYYFFPPGTSVLSVPFVAAMHLRGVSVVRRDGTYDMAAEQVVDAQWAALLMATFVAVVYFTSKLLLPTHWSLAVAFVSAFGTQVFSTASRSMWSDTWGILLVGFAVQLLLFSTVRSERVNAPLLATLESVAYVVRPTNSIVLLGTALFLGATDRRALWRFLGIAIAWLSLFVTYSWIHFHALLPDYFVAGRLHFPPRSEAFLGNLVSPSRGLLVYVPAVIAIGVAMIRFWRTLRFRALVALSGFVLVCHLLTLSGFAHWWGGYSYGARLTTSLVPWFALLGILVVDAARNANTARAARGTDAIIGGLAGASCVASVIINGIGAFSRDANDWNTIPENIDAAPQRLWSWRRPQLAAPFWGSEEPDVLSCATEGPFPILPSEGVRFGTIEADKYLGVGWGDEEGEFRWTEGRGASVVRFSLSNAGSGALVVDLGAYLGANKLSRQRLSVSMNDRDLGELSIGERAFSRYEVLVPSGVTKQENVLCLRHPDAASPATLEGTSDRRQLGVAVRTLAWRSASEAPSRSGEDRAHDRDEREHHSGDEPEHREDR